MRPPKKTETIEIRVPHATKAAFMAKCRRDGRTVSEAMRQFIDRDLAAGRPAASLARLWQVAAAAVMGLAIGAVAAPTLAHPVTSAAPGCAHGAARP